MGLCSNKICLLPVCLSVATSSWLCFKFKLHFFVLCYWPSLFLLFSPCANDPHVPLTLMSLCWLCVTPLQLTGYLQEVHCPLSICGLCIKCHCHWPEFERHLSRWGGCMYTQNGQPQHPSRSTHVAQFETFTCTFTAMAADKDPLYATVIFSMMPVRVCNPSMQVTHILKPQVLSGGHPGSYQATSDRRVSSDTLWPLGPKLGFCYFHWDYLIFLPRASNTIKWKSLTFYSGTYLHIRRDMIWD